MKKLQAIHWQRSMWITLVIICLMVSGSFIGARQVDRMEEEKSFETLHEETRRLGQSLEAQVQTDRRQFQLMAFIASGYDDLSSPQLWQVLDQYTSDGFISRLEFLLPDDTLLTGPGSIVNVSGSLSFKEEMEAGAHITNREADLSKEGAYVLRHYVPVYDDGEISAMLCGVIELGELPEEIPVQAYGGEAAMYIVEGESGNFIMDTWHETVGNIWDLGERPMAEGYDHEQLKQGLIDGKTGYVVFVSQTVGQYLYFYYEPVNINDWRVALSVPEDVVFADAYATRRIMNLFLIFEVGCFVVYFAWMIYYVVRETGKKQRQLEALNDIYQIEKLLFNAHEKQENITAALESLAHASGAHTAGLWFQKPRQGDVSFIWDSDGRDALRGHEDSMYFLMKYFQNGSDFFESYRRDELQTFLRWDGGIKNFAAVPLERLDGSICGILFAYNISVRHVSQALLKSVSFSFSMLLRNMKSYDAIRERGERDALSGLNNRNRYEADLSGYPARCKVSLACIYMDLNGLHEMNNTQGHEAGDRMIRSVADKLRSWFSEDCTYRIGGDEFVVFAADVPEEEVANRIRAVQEALEQEDIHVSSGLAWQEQVDDINVLIKDAEHKMYEAKRKFYENEKYDRRRQRR